MNTIDLFNSQNLVPTTFPDVLNGQDWNAFDTQYLAMFQHPDANNLHQFIYIFWTNQEMPRIIGSSNVLRIGETNQTLYARHSAEKSRVYYQAKWNWMNQIITQFGGIKFSFAHVNNHRDIESTFLRLFRQAHGEYPPLNLRG